MKLTSKQERTLESIKDTLTDSERYLKYLFYECEGLADKLHKVGLNKYTSLKAETILNSLEIIENTIDAIKRDIEEFEDR